MKHSSGFGIMAFIVLAIGAFNIWVGSMSVEYILSWFGKTIPWAMAAVIGLFTAEITVPIAIVGHILKMCHVF